MHSWDRGPTCMLEPRIFYKSNFFRSHIYIYPYLSEKKPKNFFHSRSLRPRTNLYDNNKSRHFATNALFKWLCHLWITEYFHNYSIFGNHCLKAWIIDLLFSPEVRGQNSHMSSRSFQERHRWKVFRTSRALFFGSYLQFTWWAKRQNSYIEWWDMTYAIHFWSHVSHHQFQIFIELSEISWCWIFCQKTSES